MFQSEGTKEQKPCKTIKRFGLWDFFLFSIRNQVIQCDLFTPLFGGHQQPLKGSFNHPKKVTSRIARNMFFLLNI